MPTAPDAVTLVEILDITTSYDEVAPLVDMLLRRLERDGVPGLASMAFYAGPKRDQLAAVITFSDPTQMVAHTKLISSWSEFTTFAARTKLVEMRIHGVVGDDVRAWMAQFEGSVAVYEQQVASFYRHWPAS